MQRVVLTCLLVAIVFLSGIYLLCGYPLILNKSEIEVLHVKDTSQVNFNPLENTEFISGRNAAYLLFDKHDIDELPKGINRRKLLACKGNDLLQQLKENFFFTKSNGDMSTCESEIYIYKDGRLVLHVNLILTDSVVGIQSKLSGWAPARNREKIKEISSKFKPIHQPIVRF